MNKEAMLEEIYAGAFNDELEKMAGYGKSSIVGAIAGAGIGALKAYKSEKSIAKGALKGALVGAGIGGGVQAGRNVIRNVNIVRDLKRTGLYDLVKKNLKKDKFRYFKQNYEL